MPNHLNVEKYIGIPFKPHGRTMDGYDCIGLVLAVLQDNGQKVPDVWKYDTPESAEVTANFLVEIANSDAGLTQWKQCKPKAGAVVLFRIAGVVKHIGVLINNHQFLHVLPKTASCIESIQNPSWSKRVVGVYEWLS